MSVNNLNVHKNPRHFISAIEFTAHETGFQPGLIEKDYYCSVILNYLSNQSQNILTFKGGTLLAKGYAGFYRLSEDLDFTLPISSTATRKLRSNTVKPFKSIVNSISDHLPEFSLAKEMHGSNQSRQYNAELHYQSLLDDLHGRILVEIGLREELITPTVSQSLNTVLLNPFNSSPIVKPFKFHALSKLEAYAEKIRAALTRNRLAIRDFFDINYALEKNIMSLTDEKLIQLVRKKVESSQETTIVFDETTLKELNRKIDSELVPTLRKQDMKTFNLENVFTNLHAFAIRINKHG